MTLSFWKRLFTEAKETVGGLVKFTVKRLTWKESLRLLKKSIVPALWERTVGFVIFAIAMLVFVTIVRLVAAILHLGGVR
jgi:hypothetical protein